MKVHSYDITQNVNVDKLLLLLIKCKFVDYHSETTLIKKHHIPINLKVKKLKQLIKNKFLLDWFINDINDIIELITDK